MFSKVSTQRLTLASLLVCAALAAGCNKQDASTPDLSKQSADAVKQATQDAANQAAQQAAQTLDKAASFVNQQLGAAQQKLDSAASQGQQASASTAQLASAAQGQLRGAASTAQALLGQAAAATGTGLTNAGHSLQRWASNAAGTASAPGQASDAAK
ncbi:hypothetical protein [Paraburkholderia guartelaensis]|nr:hypothetical protein [Paraburkholderia guartelaensis]